MELFGRKQIFLNEDINEDNIIEDINATLCKHVENLLAEEYLYWYRRGLQPILQRTKEVRPEICNKIVENHAEEIVTFKNGYFLTQPACYIARNGEATSKVELLNEYLYRSGKQQVDNEVVDWFHTVGKGALFVKSNDDPEVPVVVYPLDPRQAYVIYSLKAGNKPIAGVNVVTDDKKAYIDVYTKDKVYRLLGAVVGKVLTNDTFTVTANSVLAVEENTIGEIPIIEYQYNSVGMGAFEAVLPLLDAINNIQSNREDGIEQFIQSLAIAVNCQFEEGTTANDIRQAGMLVLKSIGENKADFKILSEQLDQTQTQVLVDYLYSQVQSICAIPTTTKGGSSTSDTGAAVLARDGWYQADTSARNTEDLFKKSNRLFDKIFVKILNMKKDLNLSLSDFELNFVRNETSNIQSKAQSFQTLLSAGLEPSLAFAKSGISNDPIADYKMSEKWIKLRWGNPDEKVETE